MTDIAKYMRKGGPCVEHGQKCRVMDAASGCACASAADEIERLRAEAKTRTLDYLGQIGQLSEELERPKEMIPDMTDLRERMLAIVNKWPHTPAGAIADAAIALVLEEAARVADKGPGLHMAVPTVAAAIRALKDKP